MRTCQAQQVDADHRDAAQSDDTHEVRQAPSLGLGFLAGAKVVFLKVWLGLLFFKGYGSGPLVPWSLLSSGPLVLRSSAENCFCWCGFGICCQSRPYISRPYSEEEASSQLNACFHGQDVFELRNFYRSPRACEIVPL